MKPKVWPRPGQESFLGEMTLSWPHLGLHLEISRLEIFPRKLS